MTIYFDMDGTLADFYNVPNWLEYLSNNDSYPYSAATPLYNFSLLARYLNILKKKNYKLGIISWVSMTATADFAKEIEQVKKDWIKKHLPSVEFDKIIITEYGIPKNNFLSDEKDILFDDVEEIRNNWEGFAFPPEEIFDILRGLIKLEDLG